MPQQKQDLMQLAFSTRSLEYRESGVVVEGVV